MSWVFEHPNAKGVLLPGQTKCHTGRLVPRVDPRDPLADPFEPEHCPVLCSPVGNFPPDPSEEADENDDGIDNDHPENAARAKKPVKSGALPLESSRERLMGCAPCGSALKWSCCGACCGPCTVWSREGFLEADEDGADDRRPPVAAEYASWDGCTPIPDDVAAPPAAPRSELGERLGRVDVGRGAVSCVAVCARGERMAVGLLDGSAAVYDLNLLEDDLAPTLVGVIQPGRPAVPRRARVRTWMDSDSDSDEEGTSGAAPPQTEPEVEPEPEAEAEAEPEPEHKPEPEAAPDAEADGEAAPERTPPVDGEANADGDDAADSPSGSPDASPSGSPSGASKKSSKEKEKGGHLSAVTCVVFSPDGGSLYTGSRDGSVKRWSLPDLELLATFRPDAVEDREAVLAAALSPDGDVLYVAGESTAVVSWEAKSERGECLGVAYQCRLSDKDKDGAGVPDATDDSDFDAGTPKRSRAPSPIEDEKTPEELAAEAEAKAAAEEEAALEARRARTERREKGFPAIFVNRAAAASELPGVVFTGSRDGGVRRWRPADRERDAEMVAHAAPVTALAVTSSGGELVTGGAEGDGELKHFRWAPVAGVDQEYAKGEAKHKGGSYVRVRTLRVGENHVAHPSGVVAVVISADERFAYSAGADPEDAVRQWSLEDGAQKLRIHEPHRGAVTALALVPDAPIPGDVGQNAVDRAAAGAKGARLLTAGEDGFVAVWAVDANDAVAGATLAAENAQRANAYVATEFQRKQERLAAREPELRRSDMAVKARKALPALERAKFPVDPETGEPKDLEDMTAKELEVMTSAELITCCLAHGLLCVNPKTPPATKREIAAAMVAHFREEREKAKIRMRQERLGRR